MSDTKIKADTATTLTVDDIIPAKDLLLNNSWSFSNIDYVYPNSRNLAALGNVLTLLPIHIIRKCLVEMDHIYAISNSTNLDLALSITEENKEATLKMLRLRGW